MALLIAASASCSKPIRGELVITVPLRQGYHDAEALPRPTGEPTLRDYDNVIVRQLLLSNAFWRIHLAEKLRDLATTEEQLYAWRDRHISIREGSIIPFESNGFVCPYIVEFRGVERSVATKVLSLMASAYNDYEFRTASGEANIAFLEREIKDETNAITQVASSRPEETSKHEKNLSRLRKLLDEAQTRVRLQPHPAAVKSKKIL